MGGEQYMNSKRRTELNEAISIIKKVIVIVNKVCDNERDAVDNYPENLQGGDKFEAMEEAVENLDDALEKIEEAKEHIEVAMK